MPRLASEKSTTGIYKRDVFLDDEDRMKFIENMVKKIIEKAIEKDR